ncbi:hypothetical protein J4711_13610 [Staphylococcus epidermidis]|nr:hypothetical protein [Staphylococcus epidermidis]
MYWYFWVIVVAIEAVAGAELVRWLPDVPAWSISLVLLVLMTLTNLVSVKSFGECEFWLASVKVAAIVVFLYCRHLCIGPDTRHQRHGVANLTQNGGFMPNGIVPVLTGAVAATGFYFGAEIVTIAAAETAEPQKR